MRAQRPQLHVYVYVYVLYRLIYGLVYELTAFVIINNRFSSGSTHI